MKTVFITETREGDAVVYSTLAHLLRDLGISNKYMGIRLILDAGRPYLYLNTIIKKAKFRHNERRKI